MAAPEGQTGKGGEQMQDFGDAYLQPPQVVFNPGPEYGPDTRKFQGIPSLACGPGAKRWAVWYGGITPGEDLNNYIMLATSEDGGETWGDVQMVIDPDGEGPVRAFDPEVWLAPDGRLWVFWAQGYEHSKRNSSRSGVWAMVADNPGDVQPRWSAPRRLTDGVMMCKPIVLSSGEWCLPVSIWHQVENSEAMAVSTDGGETWGIRGAADVPPEIRNHSESMIVEKLDGSLWMLVRTNFGIGESVSKDGGRTWSTLKPSGIPHPRTRFFIRRLASGRMLLVRHDPPDGDFADGVSKGTRSHLKACLSEDDGKTWPHCLLLDERMSVSYPDGDQAEDGTIHVIYDFERRQAREILAAAFIEEDIVRGRAESPGSRMKVVVNKATG